MQKLLIWIVIAVAVALVGWYIGYVELLWLCFWIVAAVLGIALIRGLARALLENLLPTNTETDE